jgi:hypothetical protein
MELKLRRLGFKYLLPTFSFVALAATLITTLFTVNLTAARQVVLVAKMPIAEGQQISSNLVSEVELPIGALADTYLRELTSGLVATRSILKGEFLPISVLAKVQDRRIPFRINNLPQISKAISIGDTVDVWATRPDTAGSPEAVVYRAIVASIETSNSMGQLATSVEIRIGSEYLETLLAAVDSNARISIVLNETLSDLE